jgi:hypothetical protein
MALSQSVASELLEAFRAGEGVDLIRESVRLVMQELIEPTPGSPTGTGLVPGWLPPRRVTSSCASRSCGRARSSRRSWNRGGGSIRRCMRW